MNESYNISRGCWHEQRAKKDRPKKPQADIRLKEVY